MITLVVSAVGGGAVVAMLAAAVALLAVRLSTPRIRESARAHAAEGAHAPEGSTTRTWDGVPPGLPPLPVDLALLDEPEHAGAV